MLRFNQHPLLLMLLLAVQTLALAVYTIFTVQQEGWTLFQVFFEHVIALDWNGQFNLDFSCYLTLSGLWIMWRNQFSLPSLLIAVVAMVIGIMAFAPYLLYLLTKEKGDIKKVLVGER